tara:strand:- start:568 stop:924 length:357 start_codon:yes stop_codon:yes gene_type:complete
MNDEINNLIDSFNYKNNLYWKPNQNFINDINIIIEEIISMDNLLDKNIYDILVSSGHNLTWNQDYFLSMDDYNWFKSHHGKKFFLSNINKKKNFDLQHYYVLLSLYSKLVELFELQLE